MDRFYNGRTWLGLGKLLTLGGFGFWAITDFVLLLMGKYQNAQGNYLRRPPGRYMILQVIGIIGVSIGGLAQVISIVSIVGLIVAIGSLDLEKLSAEMAGMPSGMAATPAEAWNGFQEAAREEDFSLAFRHLTPESQDLLVSLPLLQLTFKKAILGPNAVPDEDDKKVMAVLGKYGISLDPGSSPEDALNRIPDKGRLFQELIEAQSDASGMADMKAELFSGSLSDVVLAGDTATGKIDGETIPFKRVANNWLIDLEGAMDASMDVADMEWRDATSGGSSRRPGSQASLEELENGVLQTPKDPEAWYELAAKRAAYGAWTESEKELRHALELNAEQMASDPNLPDLKAAALDDSRFRLLLTEKPEFMRFLREGVNFAGGDGALKAAPQNQGTPEERIDCEKHLAQVGLNFRMYAMDHRGQFPFNVPEKDGGTLQYCLRDEDGFDANSYHHFQPLLQASFTPRLLVCPADRSKKAMDFYWRKLEATNVTYQVRSLPNLSENTPDEVLARCPIHGFAVHCDGSVSEK